MNALRIVVGAIIASLLAGCSDAPRAEATRAEAPRAEAPRADSPAQPTTPIAVQPIPAQPTTPASPAASSTSPVVVLPKPAVAKPVTAEWLVGQWVSEPKGGWILRVPTAEQAFFEKNGASHAYRLDAVSAAVVIASDANGMHVLVRKHDGTVTDHVFMNGQEPRMNAGVWRNAKEPEPSEKPALIAPN